MNEHVLHQRQKQEAQRQFLSALSSGQIHVIDRFGHEVQVGQKVLYRTPFDLVYDVMAVNPVLDPQAPPGLMSVTLAVTFPVTVQANQAWGPAIIVSPAEPKPASVRAFPRPVEGPSAQKEAANSEAAEPVALQEARADRDSSDERDSPAQGGRARASGQAGGARVLRWARRLLSRGVIG